LTRLASFSRASEAEPNRAQILTAGQAARTAASADNPEQSKRFIATAEEVGANQDSEVFGRALKQISPAKFRQRHQSDKPILRNRENSRPFGPGSRAHFF
jgi:hypothetical protein